jgi:hypothetical protein
MPLYRPAARRHAMACLRNRVCAVAGEFRIERGRRRVRPRARRFEFAMGDRTRGRGSEEASRTRQRVASYNPGQVAHDVPRAAQQDGLGSPACSDRSTPRELMFPRNTDASCTCFKLRCRAIRNASARCPPERMDPPGSGKRCKGNDTRSARVPQRKVFLVRQDDLAFADFNSDFDPPRLAAPRRRGPLRLRGVGRDLR